jgi:glycosyltransferase involved in cell wall biosynthesis
LGNAAEKIKTMKIGIYSPYIDTLGGGERYLLSFAEYCLQRDFQVELFWKNEKDVETVSRRLDLHLSKLQVNREMYELLVGDASYVKKVEKWMTQLKYDLIFWLSDGSIPLLHAKQNWLHFQIPFQIKGNKIATQYKLSKINRIICNSSFTKKFIDKSFSVKSEVVYPPVDVHEFMLSPKKKENIILSVGRFDQIMNAKRQDILIEVFKKMCDDGLGNWKLVLVGGLQHNKGEFLKLEKMAFGYPVEFKVNAQWNELVDLYKKATIYWHGAGFGIDDQNQPEKVEHFGISIVEAMAAGCIPIVYDAGGVGEIIKNKSNGYLWQEKNQLAQMTLNMINTLVKEIDEVKKAQKTALKFSKEAFFKEFDERLR